MRDEDLGLALLHRHLIPSAAENYKCLGRRQTQASCMTAPEAAYPAARCHEARRKGYYMGEEAVRQAQGQRVRCPV